MYAKGGALARSRWRKATYGCGCKDRRPSLKTLIRCWNLLQDLSTLYLQGAFLLRKNERMWLQGRNHREKLRLMR